MGAGREGGIQPRAQHLQHNPHREWQSTSPGVRRFWWGRAAGTRWTRAQHHALKAGTGPEQGWDTALPLPCRGDDPKAGHGEDVILQQLQQVPSRGLGGIPWDPWAVIPQDPWPAAPLDPWTVIPLDPWDCLTGTQHAQCAVHLPPRPKSLPSTGMDTPKEDLSLPLPPKIGQFLHSYNSQGLKE